MGRAVRPYPLAPVLLAALLLVPPALADTQVVTVLVTSDENGALLPSTSGDVSKGGAAQMLGQWVAEDKHCPGRAKQDGASACPGDLTLALSTGDHWNGGSLSTFFQGEPVAQAMARMGYAASGFGNHELDFGKDQFLSLRETGGFPSWRPTSKSPSPRPRSWSYRLGEFSPAAARGWAWWASPTPPPFPRPWRTASTASRYCPTS